MNNKIVTIIGGSGFLGTYITKKLLKKNYIVKIASRNPDKVSFLKTFAAVGQIGFVKCNILDKLSIDKAIKGSDYVINLVGLLFENAQQNFAKIHVEGAENVAKSCKKYEIQQLIHVSALGIDKSINAKYAHTKLLAESEVYNFFSRTTIVRPSIVFGFGDNFFNKFAKIAKFSPFMPVFGGGLTKFQPVYAGDVATGIVELLSVNDTKIYEFAGPKQYNFLQLINFVLKTIKRKRYIINIPFVFASAVAYFANIVPVDIITVDQINLLKQDNVLIPNKKIKTLEDLGVKLHKVEDIVPNYLELHQ